MSDFPWKTDRRFNAYSDYFRLKFGERIQKITIDAGFTCPNRDGTCGTGGCTFCDNRAFNPSYNRPDKPVVQQIEEGIRFHRKRYRKVRKYLAYFQAYSNTYAPLEKLRVIYQPALEHPEIVGIVIGTRPDCIDDEKLDYFSKLSKDHYIVIEYGIESVFDRTLERVNRGHDFATTRQAVEATAARGIRTGGHIILGLPGEKRDHWIQSAGILSGLPLNGIKFHQLQLIKGTAMALDFKNHPEDFVRFDLDDYLDIMVDIIERLSPVLIVERVAGEVSPAMSLLPGWGIRYDEVLRRFEKLLEKRDTWQGKLYHGNSIKAKGKSVKPNGKSEIE